MINIKRRQLGACCNVWELLWSKDLIVKVGDIGV